MVFQCTAFKFRLSYPKNSLHLVGPRGPVFSRQFKEMDRVAWVPKVVDGRGSNDYR